MKSKVAYLSFALASVAGAVFADPISVRTGDHQDFTRVVLSIPEATAWNIVETENQTRLNISNHSQGFDLSQAFSRISRSRILEIDADDGTLIITRNCACSTDVFEEADGLLVLDIKEDEREQIENTAAPVVSPKNTLTRMSSNGTFGYGELLWGGTPEVVEPQNTAKTQEKPHSEDVNSPDNENYVADALQSLTAQIGDASTRGILTPVVTPRLPEPTETTSKSNKNPIETLPESAPESIASTNIRITSSQDVSIDLGSSELSQFGKQCPSSDHFGIENWGGMEPSYDQMGKARAALFNELDVLQPAAVENLAKLYLHYGFGAEASKLLQEYPLPEPKQMYLLALGEIVDSGYMKQHGKVSIYSDCKSNVALWAILANESAADFDAIDTDAALRAFEKLPAHLRKSLGPKLVQRFQNLSQPNGAQAVIRNLNRLNSSVAHSATVAHTDETAIQSASDVNTVALREVAAGNSPDAPQALVRLVDQSVATDQKIPEDLALLIEAYSVELRQSQLGPDLTRVHILASAHSGQFEKAFLVLRQSEKTFEANELEQITSDVVAELVSEGSDSDFLKSYFQHVLPEKNKLNTNVAIAAAKRAFELGFTDAAEDLVLQLGEAHRSKEGALLLANIALEKGNPLFAIRILEDASTPEEEALLAKSLMQAGLTQQGYLLLQETGNSEEATVAAWLSDEWRDLITDDSGVLNSAVRLSESRLVEVQNTDRLLSASRAALEESVDARVELNRLLNALPAPD